MHVLFTLKTTHHSISDRVDAALRSWASESAVRTSIRIFTDMPADYVEAAVAILAGDGNMTT
eukprot:SAG31_NODE_11830_length_994_cov_1.113966_1_plen_61_part_10